MNSLLPASLRNSYSLRLIAALLALVLGGLSPQRAGADVSANISIWHGYDFYYPNLAGTTSTSAPVTFHWMENASGVLWKQIGDTNGVNGFWITNNLNAVIHECTNGLWKLYLNRGHVSEELYFFKMSVTGVTTNVLGDVNITSPLSGSTGVTNDPTYQWTGPSNLPEIQGSSYHNVSGNAYGITLPGNATSWSPGLLTPGLNNLFVNYYSNNFTGITFTTPTNASGTPLPGWSAQGDVHSYKISTFTVASSGGVNTNLFGHYTFDDEFDLKEDSSGLNNHAVNETYSGNGSQFPQYNATGISGGAIEFDGENALLWQTDMVNVLSSNYTISLWLKTSQSYGSNIDDARNGAAIFTGDDSGDFPVPMALTGDKLGFHTADPNHTINSVSNINSGNFTHLVVTRDATTGVKRTYVNGVPDVSGTGGTSSGIDSFEVYLGYSYYSSQGIVGVVDDLQVYTSVLSPGQIDFLYGNPGTTAPYGGGATSGGHTNIAHYRFDDSGDLGHDDSVSNNHFNSGSSWGLPVHEYDIAGAVGSGGVRFYGVSSMFHGPPNPVFTNITETIADSFSLSLWVRTTEVVGNDTDDALDGAVVIWHYASGTDDNIPVSITGNKVAFHTGDEFGNSQTLHSTNDVTDGNDHHIVVTRDRVTGVKKIYVDGVLEATETGTTRLLNANTNYFSIGGVVGHSFDGTVDDVQIYSGVLSATEVAGLYNDPGSVVTNTTGGGGGGNPNNIAITFDLGIVRSSGGGGGFYCHPIFNSVSPTPITTYEVTSPNNLCSGGLNTTSSTDFVSLENLLNEITNGLWTVYINRNDPSEQQFQFSVTSTGVSTNQLKLANILSPVNGSTGLSTFPNLSWNGADGLDSLFVGIIHTNTFVQYTNLAATDTNWSLASPLPVGTNSLYVSYQSYDVPNFTITVPVDSFSVPLSNWNASASIRSQAFSEFVVTANGINPVQLANPNRTGGNFQFQFLSQSGKTNTVQSRTNLSSGVWVNRTNILGDGNTKTVILPISSAPQEFFRVSTQ